MEYPSLDALQYIEHKNTPYTSNIRHCHGYINNLDYKSHMVRIYVLDSIRLADMNVDLVSVYHLDDEANLWRLEMCHKYIKQRRGIDAISEL